MRGRRRVEPREVNQKRGEHLTVGFCCTKYATADINIDKWADAIHKAESNDNYGIISIPCVKGEQCRQYCKNTVYNTLVKYRKQRCRAGEDDLTCLARRYCPIGSDTDNGTCQYWKKNVKWFLDK